MRAPNTLDATDLHKLAHHAQLQRDMVTARYLQGQGLRHRSNANVGLVNLGGDLSYYASVYIGESPAIFDLVVDTGSADIWMVENSCGAPCGKLPTYNPKASITFQNMSQTALIMSYGQNIASGYWAKETFGLGGYTVLQYKFAAIYDPIVTTLSFPASGWLGMAWGALSASGTSSIWQNIGGIAPLDAPLFAIQLTRYINASTSLLSTYGGVLNLGFTNTSLYTGGIHFTSIPGTPTYWQIPLTALTVQGTEIAVSMNTYAVIDTGTSYIAAPASILGAIYAQIPDSSPGTGKWEGYYMFPCQTQIDISFSFGDNGVMWPMSAADFSVVRDGTQCIGAIYGTQLSNWVIGVAFLKNVYTVFRYNPPSVGFATLSDAALTGNGVDAPPPSPTIYAPSHSGTSRADTHKPGVSTALLGAIIAMLFS